MDPSTSLNRHQALREAGLPTLSVVSGRIGLALGTVRHWAGERGRPVSETEAAGLDEIVGSWVEALAARRNLRGDALDWLARRHGEESGRPARTGAGMTPFEREVRLATVAPAAAIPPATEELCRWLLAPGEAGTPLVPAGLAGRLKGVLAARLGEGGGSARQVVAAFRDLIPSGSAPILIVSSGAAGPDSAGRIASAATSLADLAAAQPGMTLVLAIEPGDLECYLRLAPESRAKALVRTGVIRLDTPGVREIRERLEASLPGSSRRLADSVRRLSADGVSDRLADLFVEAVRETEAPPPVEPGTGDRARSAAERFLYDRLESLPETTGVFTLNGTLDIPFGPSRAMEVDLLSPTLDLAVEVDGYYHFREAEAFRRDRRKDFELQRRGYLVVRVLAEDVVGRLEEVLELILAAVATRRDRGARPRGEIP